MYNNLASVHQDQGKQFIYNNLALVLQDLALPVEVDMLVVVVTTW